MAAAQDMPPPGGFGSINYQRVAPKPIFRHGIFAALTVAMTLNGFFYLQQWRKRYRVLRIEETEHYVATHPFLLAEQERRFLIRLHWLREKERELMKDVPGWKVGTLFGEKVYKTIPKGYIPPIHPDEYNIYRPTDEWELDIVSPDFTR